MPRWRIPIFLAYIIGILILLLAYSTTYIPGFLVLDDFSSLSDVYSLTHTVAAWALAQGRILNALFIYILFDIFNSVEQGKYIRLIGVLGICVFFCLMFHLLIRRGLTKTEAFAIALAASLLPPFVEVALWAGIASYSWSCVIAVGAVLLFDGAINLGKGASGYRLLAWADPVDLKKLVYANFLIILALLSYPPAAQIVFCLPLLYLLQPGERVPLKEAVRCYSLVIFSFFISGVAFILIWKSYKRVLFPDFNLPGRELVSGPAEFLAKLQWFALEVASDAANLFKFVPEWWIGMTVLAICVAQFGFASGTWKERLVRVLLWVSLLFAAYAANILTKENWPSYRSQFALQVIIWISFATACVKLARVVLSNLNHKGLSRALMPACCSLIVFVLALRQFLIVGPAVAQPHANEWSVVKSALSQIEGRPETTRIVVVRPEWWANGPILIRFDTIGAPSSFATWVPEPMLNVAHWELYKRPLKVPVQHFDPREFINQKIGDGDLVLDMNALLQRSAALRQAPFPKRVFW